MYRQSPSRSHRSKGVKVKHVLQICLFIAICFWLIYQVKHSHDKKKEYGETDDKVVRQRSSTDEVMKLGRKDIRPREDATVFEKENHDEPDEEEEEETTEEKYEGNKNEDVPEFKEQKEDDETDEHDEHEDEKLDVDVDRETESVDDEEREDGAGNGAQETDSELTHGQRDTKISSEETDHDGEDKSVDEAREEHYKADDASSAVTHDVQTGASGNENEHVNSNDKPGSILREGNQESEDRTSESENRKYLEVGGDQTTVGSQQINVTTNEARADATTTTENSASSNITVTGAVNSPIATNSSPEVRLENNGMPENATEQGPKLETGQGIPANGTSSEESSIHVITNEGVNNTTGDVNANHVDSNSTALKEPQVEESRIENFANSSANNNHTEPSVSENISKSEISIEVENNTDTISENDNEGEALKSDTIDAAENKDDGEALESTVTENPEDLSDTSNALGGNVGVDLDTLPEIQSEGSNIEEVAAE